MRHNRGFTFIESIVFIVVISIGLTGIMSLALNLNRHSVQPIIISQANFIAGSYMEEILGKTFDATTQAACPAPPAARIDFDDMCYYKNYFNKSQITDANGNTFPDLSGFTVTVSFVYPATFDNLTPVTAPSGVIQVNVTVHNSEIPDFTLIGYRTAY